ncbi:MAG TPA: zinc ribbon domain-containing protein [Acidimicrobiia bacterium]|jgi:hypothetical protein|nr:zinc ribbon domain-containing protein [Acidimicrobiia bacterium]
MLGLLRVLAEVYNAGLQERREAWSRCGRSVRDQFQCTVCGHEQHADLNAAENIAARGRACETAWRTAGSPRLTRRKLTLRPRNETTEPPTAQAA